MLIWITGASSGLGREIASQYAQLGHRVCVSARSLEALQELARNSENQPGSVYPFPLDVTDRAAVAATWQAIVADHGLPDITLLNAGTHIANPATGFDAAVYQRLMDINFMGQINCLQAAVPDYLQRRRGTLAVVASVAGYRGLPYASAYGASKAALINLCEALQPELAQAGVQMRLINPGFVRTPLTDKNDFPMPFLMPVEDAARSAIAGLAGRRFEITFPKRFTWLVKSLRLLPYGIYLRLTRRLLRHE